MMSSIDEAEKSLDDRTPLSMTPATSLQSSGQIILRQDERELKILKSVLEKNSDSEKMNYLLKNADFNRDVKRQFNRYKREMRERIKKQQEYEARFIAMQQEEEQQRKLMMQDEKDGLRQ